MNVQEKTDPLMAFSQVVRDVKDLNKDLNYELSRTGAAFQKYLEARSATNRSFDAIRKVSCNL